MKTESKCIIYLFKTSFLTQENIFRCAVDYCKTFDVNAECIENSSIQREKRGKPYFDNTSNIHFSVSDSGEYCVCAICCDKVGIDLQEHRGKNFENISTRIFSEEEHQYLVSCNFADFFKVWSAKESYVKYTGAGINGDYKLFSTVNSYGMADSVRNSYLTFVSTVDNYTCCLCTKNKCSYILKEMNI